MNTELDIAQENSILEDSTESAAKPRRSGASERALRAAIEIFTRWENDEKNVPLDRIVSSEFRSRKYLNSGERRWIGEAIYGCARLWRRQVFLLEALGHAATPENVIRLWAEENREQGTGNREQGETGETAQAAGEGSLLAGRSALDLLPGVDRPREYLRITLSFPDAMADALEASLGDEAILAAQAFNAQAPTTLRVNPLRVSWAHLRKSLPDALPTAYSPWGLELPRRVNVYDLPGYRTGWFEVQEEASQLVSLLVDPQPGQLVAEIGAGAGGKTLALAALMENQGEIFAIDTSKVRLEELQKRAERAGASCIEICELPADYEGEWQPSVSMRRTVNRWRNRADVVLVDAPCTGSGVLRRSPDARWRDFDMTHMTQLQFNLLNQAATLVQPGGHLCYITCAFEPAQNEDIVTRFLATQLGEQFEIAPVLPRLTAARERARAQALTPLFMRSEKSQRKIAERQAQEPVTVMDAQTAGQDAPALAPEPDYDSMASGLFLRTWPHRQGLDAFFAACLRRKPV